MDVFRQLTAALQAAGVEFRATHHRPVYTSVEAAEVRGARLHSGAKALILKGDDRFILAVLPADLALDSKALRSRLGWRTLRFATKEELLDLTGLTPGSVPPFGNLFKLETYCDTRLADNESINFNAGSHEDSIQMTYAAYLLFERPNLVELSKAAEART